MGDGKRVKMGENGQQRVTIQMCHIPNAQEAKKNPSMAPKTCQKGPKVGSEYLPTSKTSHCVRTACTASPCEPTLKTGSEPRSPSRELRCVATPLRHHSPLKIVCVILTHAKHSVKLNLR